MEAEVYRYLSCCDVSNHFRDEERIELWTVFFVYTVVLHFILEGLYTTDTHTKNHTNAVFVYAFQVHATVLYGLHCRNHGQLCVAVHLASLFTVDEFGDV